MYNLKDDPEELYDLAARLICLKWPTDREAARKELLTFLGPEDLIVNREQAAQHLNARLYQQFQAWHQKTVEDTHGRFRKRLERRIRNATRL